MNVVAWSEEAERAVLGAMMASKNAIMDVLDTGLKAEHFYRPSHGLIYSAINDLDKLERPDSISVGERLRAQGKLAGVGGQSYVSTLVQEVSTTFSAGQHARIIIDHAASRRLEGAAHRIAEIAVGPGHADDKMAAADQALAWALEAASGDELNEIGVEMKTTFEEIEEAKKTGKRPSRLRTGFVKLDDLLAGGLRPGQLVVIAARPAVGKSTLAQNIAQNVGHRDVRSAFFSLEMGAPEIGLRMVSASARVPHKKLITMTMDDKEYAEYKRGKAIVEKLPILFADSGNLSVAGIRARCRRLKRSAKGLGLVIVDYLQLMEGVGAENRQQDVAAISRALKLLAMELQVPVIAVSQLNRGVEHRENKRPNLSDLRDSGAIEQDADIVAFIYREDTYTLAPSDKTDIAEIIVAKHRGGETGMIPLVFNGARCRFDNKGQAPPIEEAERVFHRAE